MPILVPRRRHTVKSELAEERQQNLFDQNVLRYNVEVAKLIVPPFDFSR